MANFKFQNMESAICDLKFRVLARTRSSGLLLAHSLTAESGFKEGKKDECKDQTLCDLERWVREVG